MNKEKEEIRISVLIIDDDKDYCESLAGSALMVDVDLKSSTNLEDGIEILRTDTSIMFVILDGNCFLNSDQESTSFTSENIPHHAKGIIDEINRDQDRLIGYCVNTGFVNDLKKSFDGIFKVFDKDQKSAELFSYIKAFVTDSPLYKLKIKYRACFEVFEKGIIELVHEKLLVDTLNCIENRDYRKKNFGPMRDLFEASLLGLIYKGLLPIEFLDSRREKVVPSQEWCVLYLSGKATIDANNNVHQIPITIHKAMTSTIRKIKEGLNDNMHLSDETILKYEFLSNAFALLEFLVWLPEYELSICAPSSHT
jgi:hypothetical protein